jgi:hypothetical protein
LLLRRRTNRQQRRQLQLSGLLLLVLLLYQIAYYVGVPRILELDVPTTVVIVVLLFLHAIEQTRFLGASLLSLPVFRSSPLALAILRHDGGVAFRNDAMERLISSGYEPAVPKPGQPGGACCLFADGRWWEAGIIESGKGLALILEDISSIRELETQLETTGQKRIAVRRILENQAQRITSQSEQTATDIYMRQWSLVFLEKTNRLLGEMKQMLQGSAIPSLPPGEALRWIRLGIHQCQRRLRLMTRMADGGNVIPLAHVVAYLEGLVQDASRLDIDCTVTGAAEGGCTLDMLLPFLSAVEEMLEYARSRGNSLILHLLPHPEGFELHAALHAELDIITGAWQDMSPAKAPRAQDDPDSGVFALYRISDAIVTAILNHGGTVRHSQEEDGVSVRLVLPGKGVTA